MASPPATTTKAINAAKIRIPGPRRFAEVLASGDEEGSFDEFVNLRLSIRLRVAREDNHR
ncbi:MAG TPA: hypothetical protein VIJ86_05165 [Acidimicrobiales bacterium]